MKLLTMKMGLLLTLLVSAGCGDRALKSQISRYRGDGKIRYLESPGLLGASGFEIRMPSVDLSTPVDIQYNLAGMPIGAPMVYLVIENPCPLKEVLRGNYTLDIKRDSKSIRILSSELSRITNGQWSKANHFYFSGNEGKHSKSRIVNEDPDSDWSLSVSWENPHLDKPLEAYILIRSGGRK